MIGPLDHVTQVHGALLVTGQLDQPLTFDIPLRFALAGHMTAREAVIVAPRADAGRNIALAQSITVK